MIYFGDSIRADIVGPKRFLPWTCGLISDEVGCEGFRGNQVFLTFRKVVNILVITAHHDATLDYYYHRGHNINGGLVITP